MYPLNCWWIAISILRQAWRKTADADPAIADQKWNGRWFVFGVGEGKGAAILETVGDSGGTGLEMTIKAVDLSQHCWDRWHQPTLASHWELDKVQPYIRARQGYRGESQYNQSMVTKICPPTSPTTYQPWMLPSQNWCFNFVFGIFGRNQVDSIFHK